MNETHDTNSMAVFCDFENIAIGVEEQDNTREFDINRVLERILLKGNIVVKKAYCDWSRYQKFKRSMHKASFELNDFPHVRFSGKNSADIRMVVDALDLCYTKEHVDTFVIISGDSDFSPLVSKLRENNKTVIGLGVKHSTSDLLIANCDEFIYYDDLVIERKRPRPKPRPATTRKTGPTSKDKESDDKKQEALDLVVETYEAIVAERGEEEKVWGSMVKQTLKRRRPGFSEAYYGFRSFGELLEEAETRKILKLERDKKSGGFVIKSVLIK